ncbi:DNA primase [Alkalihalophilus lindianensis]|uniref:DNA primase n=1 Tax=Alkalihalophilus lindianensis TaxID=1630542 RepID=A0ABU3X5F7_9BACI|nr:DNA primase [Alkalihalophilus lindianensis]MDV2683136.1 DNA primase [Alkalihalophilus lindianensis]
MSSRIPEEKIEQIRKTTDIVEVISDYVQLKKQGRQYTGLCPFHGEKTPSFSVSQDKQLYHCFGCGAGGNVFSFLMEHEGYSFVDAAKQLADRANIELPVSNQREANPNSPQKMMMDGHELAAKLYHHVLTLTEEGSGGREYAKARAFQKEQLEHFQIGFAPNRWDSLKIIFEKREFNLDVMANAGLLGTRESDQGHYDRFRNRLMFPIWDGQGKVIAFGGRSIGDEKPKYLNSAETPIFHKSKTLYAIHLARPSIRKENAAILFEGYVDVVAAWGAGVKNGVATLGTALTEEQAKLLRRNAETVTLCYDSDRAGIEAAFRSAGILEQVGCHVKIALMPEGLDPDDFIRKFGADRFKTDVIGASLSLMAFKMRFLRKGKNLQDEGERLRYIEEVLTEIASLPRAVERDHYLRQVAEEFSLSLDALKQEQFQIYRAKKQQKRSDKEQPIKRTTTKALSQKKLLPAYKNAERLLLAHMMRDVEIAEQVQERIGGQFNVDEYHAIAAYLFAYYGEGNEADPSRFVQRLDDPTLMRIASELAMLPINEECSDQEIIDYMKQIENYPKWVDIQQKELLMKQEHDPVAAARLKMEIIQMKKQLH